MIETIRAALNPIQQELFQTRLLQFLQIHSGNLSAEHNLAYPIQEILASSADASLDQFVPLLGGSWRFAARAWASN